MKKNFGKIILILLLIGCGSLINDKTINAAHGILTWTAAVNTNWDTATLNWLDDGVPVAWKNAPPNDAVFDSAGAGPITVTTAITVNSFTFNSNSYIISSDALNHTISLHDAGTIVSVATSKVAEINSKLVGNNKGISKQGKGTLILSGDNSYSGDTTITAGTVQAGAAGNDNTLGSGDVVFNAAVGESATLKMAANVTANNRDYVFTTNGIIDTNGYTLVKDKGDITGAGKLIKIGTGTLELATDSSLSGGIEIQQGTVLAGRNGKHETLGTGDITFNGADATLKIATNLTSTDVDYVMTQTGTIDTNAHTLIKALGSITGAGGLTKVGTGTLELEGINTFTGTLTVQGGEVALSNGAALADTVAVVLSTNPGVNLEVYNDETIGSLSGGNNTGGNVTLNGGATLTVGDNTDTTFGGSIVGVGALTKIGTGKLTLTHTSTYLGDTNVNGGELQVNGLISGSVNTNVDGGLLSGTGEIRDPVTIANTNGSELQGGTGTGNAGTLETQDITFNGSAAKLIVNTDGATTSKIVSDGIVTLGGMTVDVTGTLPVGTYDLITADSVIGTAVIGLNSTGKTATLSNTGTVLRLTISTGGGGGGGGGGGHHHSAKISTPVIATTPVPPSPTLIYEPTACAPIINLPIYVGKTNDILEVKKLQSFLNEHEGEMLAMDGIYKTADIEAVKRFQLKYKGDILDFWGLTKPTGNVLLSTRKAINRIKCEREYQFTCPYFDTGVKMGVVPTTEVVKIRSFLAHVEKAAISEINPIMDQELVDAIKRFQTEYAEQILKPWGLSKATGNWYQSTIRQANEILGCYYPTRLSNGVILP